MQGILYDIISLLIALVTFIYGAVCLFKKKKPLYFQLLICAVGCFTLRQLSHLVMNLCCIDAYFFTIGSLGIFGCNFFLLSANYGQLDSIVDDGSKTNQKARIIAFAAPILMLILLVLIFVTWKSRELFNAVMWVIVLIPALPAAYFNLKHLIMPMDDFRFLEATKITNLVALVFYLITSLSAFCQSLSSLVLSGVSEILMALLMCVLSLTAVRGAKKWGI